MIGKDKAEMALDKALTQVKQMRGAFMTAAHLSAPIRWIDHMGAE
ncbi:MAG: hypothetical protein PVI90_04345 [Desulfobacteraceae bacterium]|jgi:hypothetical protein